MLFDIMEEIERCVTILELTEIISKYNKKLTKESDYILFMVLLKLKKIELSLPKSKQVGILKLIKYEVNERTDYE